jgi:hypothetical protein
MIHNILAIALLLTSLSALAQADKKAGADRLKEEVAQHRRLAEVHENAARCLESGKPEKECHAQLEKACKGVGIGKYCGMRHTH